MKKNFGNMITRNLHSPLKIEIVLKAHYHPKYMINRWNKAEYDAASQLLKDHILVRFAEHDSDADQLTLTEKGKVFVEMILNTPYPIQSWTDPRN
jgi:hypothetical protein